jgi:hypothetical protein
MALTDAQLLRRLRRSVLDAELAFVYLANRFALFAAPAHAVFKDIRVSTSTLASPHLQLGGFGPVSGHSYAVGYGVDEAEGALFNVMAYTREGAAAALGEPPGGPPANAAAGEPFAHPDVDAYADALDAALTKLGRTVERGASARGARDAWKPGA